MLPSVKPIEPITASFLALFNFAFGRLDRVRLVLTDSAPHFQIEFRMHCVLSGGTQHRGFLRHQNEENENMVYFI